jgi:mRNA degradation ribonuclease J1/J2
MFHIHCSGHIMPTEIKQIITKIAPKTLFPIHTEYPALYSKFVSDVTRVQLPQKSRRYQSEANADWK